MVTVVKSQIRRPYWEKRTLCKLGLTKRMRTVVLKNTAEVNKDLKTIRHLVEVRPIYITNENSDVTSTQRQEELKNTAMTSLDNTTTTTTTTGDLALLTSPFLNAYGGFDVGAYEEYINKFPEDQLEEKLGVSHYAGSDTLNHNFYQDEVNRIEDKGRQIVEYFKRDTWHTSNDVKNRHRNKTKY